MAQQRLINQDGRMQTHLLIVDYSDLVRNSLRALLGNVEGIASIHEAATLGEALDSARCHPPTLVILDLHLPDGLGTHIIHQLKQFAPLLRIAMLTIHAEPLYRRHCLALGVDWFFDKATEVEGLLEVVRQHTATNLLIHSNQKLPPCVT
jgi:DNA-binding NarL/FixJ family response regulator